MFLKSAAFARSTRKTYHCQSQSYFRFCLNYGLQPVPASQDTIVSYMAFLSRSLAPNSVKGYMNAIRIIHLEAGFSNPLISNWEVNMIQKGISRLMGKPPKQKLPITIPILIDLLRSLTDHPCDLAFRAACLIAFFGFLRKSTLLPVSEDLVQGKYIARSDVMDLTLSSFQLQIKYSKTIQFGQRILSLPYVVCDDTRLCPVRAILSHLGRSKLQPSRPLFNYVSGLQEVHFSTAFFMKKLRSTLVQAGHPASDISCHSFRRGGASLAYMVGLSATDIKLRGEWRSNAFEQYLCVSKSTALQSAKSLSAGALSLARDSNR